MSAIIASIHCACMRLSTSFPSSKPRVSGTRTSVSLPVGLGDADAEECEGVDGEEEEGVDRDEDRIHPVPVSRKEPVLQRQDQEEALAVADRVGVMNAGRLEQLAAPAELYTAPATPPNNTY